MDPNEALKKARAALAAFRKAEDADVTHAGIADTVDAASDLADAFEALDGWLQKGGFLPSDWSR